MAAPTAGRRDSRIHLQLRHSDAFQEHEAFRRKYLLVNKHITKLNAGLNVRVEELNGTVNQLTAENIALRTRVIELTRRLACEQAAARRTISEAELYTTNVIHHLTTLRDRFSSLSSPVSAPAPPPLPPSLPRPSNPRTSLAKKPDISFIREASVEFEEPLELDDIPSPSEPLQDESPSPLTPATFITSRRPARRPSNTVAPSSSSRITSPPPSRGVVTLDSGPSEEEVEEELEIEREISARRVAKGKRKSRTGLAYERQKLPRMDEPLPIIGLNPSMKKLGNREGDLVPLREESADESQRAGPSRKPSKRRILTPPPSSPPLLTPSPLPGHRRNASTPLTTTDPNGIADSGGDQDGARERRVRKSVNYAEPKLNTKMRKPESYESKPAMASKTPHSTPRQAPSISLSKGSATGSIKKTAPPDPQSDGSDVVDATEGVMSTKSAVKVRRHTLSV